MPLTASSTRSSCSGPRRCARPAITPGTLASGTPTAGQPPAAMRRARGCCALGGPTAPARFDTKGREITGYVGAVFQSDDGHKFPEWGVGLTPETPGGLPTRPSASSGGSPSGPFSSTSTSPGPTTRYSLHRRSRAVMTRSRFPFPPTSSPSTRSTTATSAVATSSSGPGLRTPRMVREELALYYAVITDLDAQVGRILSALEETGQADRTIVVFASDQGLAIRQSRPARQAEYVRAHGRYAARHRRAGSAQGPAGPRPDLPPRPLSHPLRASPASPHPRASTAAPAPPSSVVARIRETASFSAITWTSSAWSGATAGS